MLMTDITRAAESLAAGRPGWRPERGTDVGHQLAGRVAGELEWDDGAGENWSRVIVNRQAAVALIYMRGPLLIVLARIAAEVADITTEWPTIVVPALDDEILSCDPQVLRTAFGDQVTHETLVNAERFSASDLWYATV
jgi:hypothetical protein